DGVGGDLVEAGDGGAGADAPADQHGGGEPHAVQAVVDAHGDVVDPAELAGQERNERQRKEAVSHGSSERPGRGALRVDVDPLVVLGVVGEAVDPLLVDLEPAGGADLLAHRGFQLGHAVVALHLISRRCYWRVYPRGSSGPARAQAKATCPRDAGRWPRWAR